MSETQQTTVGGLRAVELYYRVVRESASGHMAFIESQTRLNTPGLGTLMPENFRDVAEITNQCVNLFELEYLQALEACKEFQERELIFDWLSVYMPPEYLRDIRAERNASELAAQFGVHTNKICFAVSAKLFAETDPNVPQVLKNLRNRGFHSMLTGFGSDACPMMKLSDFEIDYVMLSPEVTNFLGRGEKSDSAVKSIIDFVTELDATPIADGVVNSRQAEQLFRLGCLYCTGSLVGKFMSEKYMKRKTSDDN